MRRMAALQEGQKSVQMTTTFQGYNHNEIISDGEMYDMRNLSGDLYPMMTVRKKRAWQSYKVGDVDDPLTGIDGRDQLTFVVGTKVYYAGDEIIGLQVSDDPKKCPKQIINFGGYVLIFPDKKYFNTINTEDHGFIDRIMDSISGNNVSLSMCRGDGTDYDLANIPKSPAAPESPDNGDFWIDQSGDNDVLRQYTVSTEEWVEVPTTYVKISATNIGTGLEVYDAITIAGLELKAPVNPTDDEQAQYEKLSKQVAALNGSKIVYQAGTGYVLVVGLISWSVDEGDLKTNTIKADRKMPDLDYIVESNNRLWGCRYGLLNNVVVNEIHASALGNFKNWERYLGNSQDSYTASVGTDGPFTGAVTQKGYPVFFKENCIHQVYGNTPSSFQINTTVCRGIQQGSSRSAVVVNEQVYYKGRTDVMMFDGSMPVSVSNALGKKMYFNARAGALGDKYYINMEDINGDWTLFTYDTKNGVWYKEDQFKALGFGRVENELYAIDEVNNRLYSMTAAAGDDPEDEDYPSWHVEEDPDWCAVFGIQGIDYKPNMYGRTGRDDTTGSRYLSRFDIRMYLGESTFAVLEIQYDDSGVWEKMGEIRGTRTRNYMLPVIPKRCDHLRFRMRGRGPIRVYSISRIMEVGADG